ncbi:uncharacterized protein TRUGW13939_03366 [Talaromyces rugulosus]|uniref:Uncharacterized protein n=1 Tax=Talaromyces rugulosus TaxID=121627 RepID=A0A7H8QS37_TALRU|nr:uncharacterized protein TRUGW13939_03366 [Talaromyces rugulosus]QKX56265.1 hypothetical protein TRUGW13939_03366 [Talaromyces rugulosus]
MIQTRIPRSPFFPAYPDMTHEMRCLIAKELGKVYSELHSTRSVTAGKLTLSPSQTSLMIQPFDNAEPDGIVPYENGPATQSTFDMLRAILDHKKELAVALGPNQSIRVSFFEPRNNPASTPSRFTSSAASYYRHPRLGQRALRPASHVLLAADVAMDMERRGRRRRAACKQYTCNTRIT